MTDEIKHRHIVRQKRRRRLQEEAFLLKNVCSQILSSPDIDPKGGEPWPTIAGLDAAQVTVSDLQRARFRSHGHDKIVLRGNNVAMLTGTTEHLFFVGPKTCVDGKLPPIYFHRRCCDNGAAASSDGAPLRAQSLFDDLPATRNRQQRRTWLTTRVLLLEEGVDDGGSLFFRCDGFSAAASRGCCARCRKS